MVNTRKKFPREYTDQVISNPEARTASERASDPGLKPKSYVWFFQDHKWKQRYDPKAKRKVSSSKPQAPIFRKRQALQASSHKLQAP